MAKARPRENVLDCFTRSEAEKIIYEANLGKENTKIAQLYYIEQMPQIEIAEELLMDRKTVGERIRIISAKIGRTADKYSA